MTELTMLVLVKNVEDFGTFRLKKQLNAVSGDQWAILVTSWKTIVLRVTQTLEAQIKGFKGAQYQQQGQRSSCEVLAKNMAAVYPCPNNQFDTKLESNFFCTNLFCCEDFRTA